MRRAVGASEQDAVLFTGQGTAAALRALLRHLDLSKSTVVFVGPFEHHANLRPWREHGVRVREIYARRARRYFTREDFSTMSQEYSRPWGRFDPLGRYSNAAGDVERFIHYSTCPFLLYSVRLIGTGRSCTSVRVGGRRQLQGTFGGKILFISCVIGSIVTRCIERDSLLRVPFLF